MVSERNFHSLNFRVRGNCIYERNVGKAECGLKRGK